MFRLLVMVHRHRQHVQSDEQHDYHVELRIGADFEHDGLWSPLRKRENNFLETKQISMLR